MHATLRVRRHAYMRYMRPSAPYILRKRIARPRIYDLIIDAPWYSEITKNLAELKNSFDIVRRGRVCLTLS